MKKEKYIFERKTKSGTSYVVSIKSGTGNNRKTITRSFSSNDYGSESIALKAAILERDKILNDLRSEKFVFNNPITFSQVYEESKELFPRRYNTNRKNNYHVSKYLQPLAQMRMQEITAYDIMMCLNSMVSVASDKTISETFTLVKRVFKTARIKRYITIDVTDEVILPKSEYLSKPRKKITSKVILDQIVDVLESSIQGKEDHHAIVGALYTMYYCGLRPAEAFALNKEDVNLLTKKIHIDKQLGSSYTEKTALREAKTERSVRDVIIPDELKDMLIEFMREDGCPILFHTKQGNYFRLNTVQALINRISDRLGVDFSMYQLRHLFATDLVTSNTDVRTVMELMGHESPTMTVEYARSNDKKKIEAIEKRHLS